jgi:hypothetical protein
VLRRQFEGMILRSGQSTPLFKLTSTRGSALPVPFGPIVSVNLADATAKEEEQACEEGLAE